jgi:hypothetical protein
MVSFLCLLDFSEDHHEPAQQQLLEVAMEQYIGEIRLFPYNFVPARWAACIGALLPINSNVALYSLLGTDTQHGIRNRATGARDAITG